MEVTLQRLPDVHWVGGHTGACVFVRCLSPVFLRRGVHVCPLCEAGPWQCLDRGTPSVLKVVKGQ